MSHLGIAVEAGTSGCVVRLSGESDLVTAGQLAEALTAQIAGGTRRLTVEMSGLRFADSATIRVLIQVHRALSDAGGSLELLGPQPSVYRSLQLLGVDQVLTIRAGNGSTGG